MKMIYRATEKCPYCGRPMSRPTAQRLLEPFCQQCLPERMKKANAAAKVPPSTFPDRIFTLQQYI